MSAAQLEFDCRTCTVEWCKQYPIHWYCHRKEAAYLAAQGLIDLPVVVYDKKARGIYCKLSYPDHPDGCPNTSVCIAKHPDFLTFKGFRWFAVIEEFDLKVYAQAMGQKHPGWSERQCRNLLYWQGGVRSRLLDKAIHFRCIGDVILTIPEACGVHVFETMARVGVAIQRNPDVVRKVMLIGRPSDFPSQITLLEVL